MPYSRSVASGNRFVPKAAAPPEYLKRGFAARPWKAYNKNTFRADAVVGPGVDDLDKRKHQVFELVKELVSLTATQERETEIGLLLNRLCPDPQWSNYIFWSEEFHESGRLNIGKVVDKIFSYKPIRL